MHKSTLAVAVSQLLNPTGNTVDPNDVTTQGKPKKTVKVPVADMTLQQHDAMTDADLAIYFDDKRRDMIEEYAAIAEDLRYSTETKRDQMAQIASRIWPSGKVTYNEARTVSTFLKSRSEYAYKCMVKSIKSFPAMGAKLGKNGKLILGKMPSKAGGLKSGKRTASAATWQSTMAKSIKAMRERMAKSRKVIDPAALVKYADAFKALDAALKLDRKAS
jgi:hypothetical protein